MQFSRHGTWAHPYPEISPTFWQCRDILPLEQKCFKHWTQQTWMLQALFVNLHELSVYLRIECNFFTCFLELVLAPPPDAESCYVQTCSWEKSYGFTPYLDFNPLCMSSTNFWIRPCIQSMQTSKEKSTSKHSINRIVLKLVSIEK